MKIINLDHFVLTTNDFNKCVWFYRDVLGMQLEDNGGRYAFRFGNQKINIHQKPAEFLPAASNIAVGSLDICLLTTTDLETVCVELKAQGINIEEGIVKRTGAQGKMNSIYVYDPDGNLIEISKY